MGVLRQLSPMPGMGLKRFSGKEEYRYQLIFPVKYIKDSKGVILEEKFKDEKIDFNPLIKETNMTWDKHLGVVCSNREGLHDITIDAEEAPIIRFNEKDIPIIEKYFNINVKEELNKVV